MNEKQERSFWMRYRTKLTQDERRELVNDGSAISRPRAAHLPAPQIPASTWIEVRSNYRVKFGPLVETAKTYRYEVTHREDFRARMPRRTPGIFDVPDLDDAGFPLPPSPEAIKEATEQGNYTSSASLAVPDAGEAVDPFTQKRLTREARDRERSELEQMICAMEDVRSALDERMRMSPDLAREIGKELWQIRGRIDAAKARLKRRMVA